MSMILHRQERKRDNGVERSDKGEYLRNMGRLSAELYRGAAEKAVCGTKTIIS